MRCYLLMFALVLFHAQTVKSQDDAKSEAVGARVATIRIELAEVSLKEEAKVGDLTAGKDLRSVIKRLNEGGFLESREYMQCSLVEGFQTSMMHGRSIALVAGVSQTPAGRMRQMQQTKVGTSLELIAERNEDRVGIKITYESSKIVGEGSEDAPPDIVTSQYLTAQILVPGRIHLVGQNAGVMLLARVVEIE